MGLEESDQTKNWFDPFFENNTVDPDQLASEKVGIYAVFNLGIFKGGFSFDLRWKKKILPNISPFT